METSPKKWRACVAMGALMLVITAGFYWKVTLTDQYSWFGAGRGDISLQVLPWYQFEAREFHAWRMPLWEPHQWMGQPLLAQGQPGAAYPLNWLLFALPLKNGGLRVAAINWYFIVVHVMAMAFCFTLCRDLGRSKSASLIAGIVFSLAGYIGTTDWPQMVNGALWAPLVLMFLLRAVRPGVEQRWAAFQAALSGGALGMAWLSGHHQIPLFVTLTIGCVWLFYILEGGRIGWGRVRLAALAFGTTALVSAMLTLPTYEYGKRALRWAGAPEALAWDQKVPYNVHTEYSMTPASLLGIFIPGVAEHADPFVGVVAFALALAGFAMAWRHRAARIATAIALGGLFLSLGFHDIFHGILYSLVPLVEKARNPSMAIFIFHLGFVVLVAFGVDAFFDAAERPLWKVRIAAGAAVLGFALWFLFVQSMMAAKLSAQFDDRTALVGVIAIVGAGILFAFAKGRLERGHAIAALVLLMLIELGNDSGYTFQRNQNGHRLVEQFEVNADIARYLKQQPGPFRVETDPDALQANFGDWYGIDVLDGYLASVLANVVHLDWSQERDKNLLGVAYYVGKKPSGGAQELVFQGTSGLNVYRNPAAFPRVWTVHSAVGVKNEGEANVRIRDPGFDLRRAVTMADPFPAFGACDPAQDALAITRMNSRAMTINAQLGCNGLVVISQSFTTGWVARVDGQVVEIREVDGALEGVPVAGGRHEIRLSYLPRSFVAGSILSFVGLLGICVLGWRARRR